MAIPEWEAEKETLERAAGGAVQLAAA